MYPHSTRFGDWFNDAPTHNTWRSHAERSLPRREARNPQPAFRAAIALAAGLAVCAAAAACQRPAGGSPGTPGDVSQGPKAPAARGAHARRVSSAANAFRVHRAASARSRRTSSMSCLNFQRTTRRSLAATMKQLSRLAVPLFNSTPSGLFDYPSDRLSRLAGPTYRIRGSPGRVTAQGHLAPLIAVARVI